MTPPHPETSAGRRLDKCPECGAPATKTVFKIGDPTYEYAHATRLQQMREALEEFVKEYDGHSYEVGLWPLMDKVRAVLSEGAQ